LLLLLLVQLLLLLLLLRLLQCCSSPCARGNGRRGLGDGGQALLVKKSFFLSFW